MADCKVLVVGAGPTGLALALWLTRLGVPVRIIDKTSEPGTTSRALAVQARTLELYRQMDLTEEILRRGHRTPAVNLWVKGQRAARVPFETVGEGLTPYPFLLIFPQDEHERLLIDRLRALGVSVERRTELVGLDDHPCGVRAQLRREGEAPEDVVVDYLAGCDGARSRVREATRVGFPGGTYRQLFYVADVEATGPAIDGELHIDLDEADFLGVFPLSGHGRARLIGTVRDERADHPETLKFEDVSSRAIEHLKVSVRRVNWFSTYHVHHRVTETFRQGRVFLIGDAAHIHSPAGGQGMNTGIGDAINLAWKLAQVIDGRGSERLLDSYERERIGFARRLVATTDRVFTFATADGLIADTLRTRVAPLVIPRVIGIDVVREYLFRTVGQITLNYRNGPLSKGVAGKVHGGDRLPWVRSEAGDNFQPLTALTWQAHVYGAASGELSNRCAGRGIPLTVFPWGRAPEGVGLARDALYLLRPDTYVALADPSPSADGLDRYFAERNLSPGRPRN